MLKGAIARRYAGAMFNIGLRENALDRILEDVRQIAEVFSHRTLAYLLREPNIPTGRKENAIRQALASKVLPASLNLALLIVQRQLVEVMPNIARELDQMVLNYHNQAIAEVTTATSLDETLKAEIKQALEHRTGKSIILHAKVDPSILGGVVARVGDQVIDGSVQYRLQALRHELINGVAAAGADDAFSEIAQVTP